ncbi:MAG: HAMP domain-containing histidine kinase [Alphaproteobacteria bacterium]|nr:HAMP domain-containing histidine kinase [Alphaproteobacteria bacterium]
MATELLGRAKAAVDRATRTLANSLSPTADETWLTAAQLELYRSSTKHAAWLVPVAIFFVSQAVTPWVDQTVRTTWFLAMALVSVLLELTEQRLDQTLPRDAAGIHARACWFTVVNTAFLIAWCSMTVYLWVPGVIANHMMLVLILACSLAGSVSATAMHPALALGSVGVHAAFILGPTAGSPDPLDRTLAGLALVYILLLTGQFMAAHKSTARMLRLEHERASLVEQMKKANEESDRARARAAAAGKAKAQFLSHMNHELRTPMNAILGFSEMIHQKAFGDATDRYAEYGGIIHESGTALLSMIDGVLNLAKIEGGKLSLREGDVDLARIIQAAAEQHEVRAAEARLTISAAASSDFLLVRADERALRQILANLVSNAIKFTAPGGKVTLFAYRDLDGRPVFGVQDTGIGMREEDQVDVFDRFGHGRHEVTTADRGLGLGLAIVKGFAVAHDGEVRLQSELTKGTRVTVYLPADRLLAAPEFSASA